MRRSASAVLVAVLAVMGSAATFVPAQAGIATISPGALSDAVRTTSVQQVQNRGDWRRDRSWNRDWDNNRRWRRGRDWDDRRWRGRHRHDDDFGAAAAAGIFGFAAGAIIGGALSGNEWDSHVRACQAQYRSYDPYTDTFLGYDGLRYRCTAF
jgi:hypothetical protein